MLKPSLLLFTVHPSPRCSKVGGCGFDTHYPEVCVCKAFWGVGSVTWLRPHPPFTTALPDKPHLSSQYFPAREHCKESIAAMQAGGMRVIPYINGQLFDTLIPK